MMAAMKNPEIIVALQNGTCYCSDTFMIVRLVSLVYT